MTRGTAERMSDADRLHLWKAVQEHGFRWRRIARDHFPERSEDSVRNQYRRSFGPRKATPRVVARARPRPVRQTFTAKDNERLTRAVLDHDMRWPAVAEALRLPNSSCHALRNRWSRHVRYGDPSVMTTVLVSSREVDTVLRTLTGQRRRRAGASARLASGKDSELARPTPPHTLQLDTDALGTGAGGSVF